MRNKHDMNEKDQTSNMPRPDSASPELTEQEEQPRKGGHAGEDEMDRRNQSIKDRSIGAPVTGFPGTPKPARR